jgi:NAD(P)-dependent dehydrogenase (short-subunit alcohol dehydrogenase family)
METGLAGKRVLVTGASGSIGSACARAFAAEGCRVVVHYHRGTERAEELVEDLEDAVAIQADLTDEAQVERLFAESGEAFGGLDVCAAVVGVWPEEDVPLWRLPLERWEGTLRANLTATFLTARGFLREVERQGHESLVLIGSTAGIFGRRATPTMRLRSRRSSAGCSSASRTKSSGSRQGRGSTPSARVGRCRR